MTILIGLMGPAGAGKSSVAGYLESKYGARRYSFAGPLKDLAMNAFGFTREQCWGTQAEKEAVDPRYNHSARWFLQRLGTEGCRKTFGEDFWTSQLLAKVKREAPTFAVIEDARFVNEALAIRDFSRVEHNARTTTPVVMQAGFVWRLDSPDRETAADATHASELEWLRAPCDHTIMPAKRGLDLLFSLVDDACAKFGIRGD